MNMTSASARARRSFIFVPGLQPGMFAKALASGADMICVELEDGIAPKDKAEARRCGLALFAAAGRDGESKPYLDLNDAAGMTHEAELARELGFCGKGAIHPKQVARLNRVFTPSATAVAHARKIIAAFDAADTGLVVVDGKLIEAPVLREMHRIVAVAERVAAG